MKIPLIYNIRSVRQRPVSTALTALGIGLVVAVFVAMLALANGFVAALVTTGSSDNVLLLRRGADSEMSSGIPREAVSIISASPHIASGVDGKPMISPETYIVINLVRPGGDQYSVANVVARGVSDKAFDVRRNIKVIEGRRFASGQSEICVGSKLLGRFANVAVGNALSGTSGLTLASSRPTRRSVVLSALRVHCPALLAMLIPFHISTFIAFIRSSS